MVDYLVNQCRFLPVSVQLYLFTAIYGIFQAPHLIFGFFWWVVLGLEIIILWILVRKNIIYRNVSVVEKAINWRVFWIKTNNAKKVINIYIIGGFIFLLVTIALHVFWYQIVSVRLIAIYLVGVLFTLKGVFYTPVVTIRYNYDESCLALINEYKKTKLIIDVSDFSRIKITNKGLGMFDSKNKEILKMEVNFLDDNDDTSLDNIFSEKIRLQRFLEGILPHKEISIIH